MKKLLSLTLCAALLLTLPACAKKEEKPQNPYRCTSIHYEFLDVDGNTSGTETYEFIYTERDTDLHTTQITYEDGIKVMEVSYEKDSYGNIIGITRTENGETKTYNNKLTLDEQHRPTRIESYCGNDLNSITEYTYDEDGNETCYTHTTIENGEATEYYETRKTYDRDGNMTSQSILPSNIYLSWTHSDGKLIKREQANENGVLQEYAEFEYDVQGREIKETLYSPSGIYMSSSETTYDETGLVVTFTNYTGIDTHSTSRSITTYDEYGNTLDRIFQIKISGEWQTETHATYTYEPIPTS